MLGVICVSSITSLLAWAYYSECATNANEEALIDSEDEIGSLEDLLEEEMRVATKNVQPSSCAALRNAKRAVIEMKAKCHRSAGSRERRMDLAEKVVGCLASHKTYYKVAQ